MASGSWYITSDPMSVGDHAQRMFDRMRSSSGKHPSIGIGIAAHSARPPLELNSYTYTTNNPLRWVDPDGQNTIAVGGGIGAAIAGPPGAVIGAGIGALIGVGGYLIYEYCKDKECPPS